VTRIRLRFRLLLSGTLSPRRVVILLCGDLTGEEQSGRAARAFAGIAHRLSLAALNIAPECFNSAI
jgi:hypothetical protein